MLWLTIYQHLLVTIICSPFSLKPVGDWNSLPQEVSRHFLDRQMLDCLILDCQILDCLILDHCTVKYTLESRILTISISIL